MGKGRGVRIGLRDLHFAKLTTDDPEASEDKLEYEEPEKIIGAITANVNPNASTETLFADDGPMESATALGEIELEMEAADLPLEIQAKLLGHEFDETNGKLIRRSDDTPPWVAVGFRSLKSNGSYRYVWLLKGKFMVPEQDYETRTDSVDFQTPTINGAFVRRDVDDTYQIDGDEDVEGFDTASWFEKSTLEEDYSRDEEGGTESVSTAGVNTRTFSTPQKKEDK